ncbi:MAG: hypothetical protein CM1200mP3_12970 [Chloroflexota bacterium]|nr:MAG: hypothetical protein CM1200mP3_12970 [Chloroflexota bacterium]
MSRIASTTSWGSVPISSLFQQCHVLPTRMSAISSLNEVGSFHEISLLIHSMPLCHPSTLGGLSRSCPCKHLTVQSIILGEGNRPSPTSLTVPTTTSVGFLTLLNLCSLKNLL